ncbi:MAG: hypothetical protein GX633_08085 [Clostridiales bacterium]|nr:hypothetical protein [Clostridiales bacterium]
MKKEYTESILFPSGMSLYDLQSELERMSDIHSKIIGLSRDDIVASNNAFWVLSRLCFRFFRPIKSITRLDVTTWHWGSVGALSNRGYDLLLEGEAVGIGISSWAIIDLDTRRIVRPSLVKGHDEAASDDRGRPEIPMKIKNPKNPSELPPYIVTEEDIDINGHMNNTRYTRLTEKYIEIPDIPVEYTVNYISEARKGDRIYLSLSEGILEGKLEYKECFKAAIKPLEPKYRLKRSKS